MSYEMLKLLIPWIIVNADRILLILPEPAYSHQVAYRPITVELARRGHNVTVFTPIPINNVTLQNYTEVKLFYSAYKTDKNLDVIGLANLGLWPVLQDYHKRNKEMTDSALSHPIMQQLISPNSTEKFDLIIVECLVYDAFYALANRFNAPLIGIASVPALILHHYSFGNPISWAYLPDLQSHWGENMNLLERIVNTYYNLCQMYWYRYQIIPVQEKMVRKYFGDSVPPAHELVSNMDLLLLNFHLFLYPHPNVPGIIPIRGSRPIDQYRHNLTQDLQTILDDAKEGFIYFSLGSNIRSEFLSDERRDMFLKTFKNLPYTVLWKFESDLTNKPKNVIIRKWLPQHAVLAHPNIKLFIYQGGLQSTEEATENGVPVIGLPVVGDQHYNVKQMEVYGTGKKLSITNVNKDELRETIFEVITNPSYKNNMLRLRDLLHDLPYDPLNNTVWWIEHVIRHKGARHLRNKSRDMPWYKTQLLDIQAILFVSLVLIAYIIVVIIRFIFWIVRHLLKKRSISSAKKQQ